MEYFWDTDPGVGKGQVLQTFTGSAANVQAELDVSSLSTGIHQLGIRALNNSYFSATCYKVFYVTPTVYKVQAVEYFFDQDPGVGKGMQMAASLIGDELNMAFDVNTEGLADGVHKIGIRVLTDGTWSDTKYRQFLVRTVMENYITRVEYFWDNDPGLGYGNSVAITQGEEVDANFEADMAGLTKGTHKLYIRAQSGSGASCLSENSVEVEGDPAPQYDDLQEWVDNPGDEHCGCKPDDPYTIDISCEGMPVKKDVTFPESNDDLYWFINGQPEGQTDEETEAECEKTIDEGEHDINIKPGSTVYIRWIHWKGCGCQKHIYVWGTLHIQWRVWFYNYWRFIHVMPGGKVIIDDLYGNCTETVFHTTGGKTDYNGGDCTGGQYGWNCEGGEFNMNGGKLTGGTCGGWTGKDGKSCHNGGTVCGGIHNYGKHYFYSGYCTGGDSYTIYNHKGGQFYYYGGTCSDNGKIWNEGDLYIDGSGNISCGDIYCVRGGCIYILKKLTFIIRLIFTEENIVSGETVVIGGDGYKLTQDDVDKMQITLPAGYEWKFDPSCGCISIYKPTGITGADTDRPMVKDSYNASGRKTGEGTKGLNIQRMTDGTVRKTVTK